MERKTWVSDVDGNVIELEDDEVIPVGATVHVRFADSSGRTDGYIRDRRGRAYLEYIDRLTNAHCAGKQTRRFDARVVADAAGDDVDPRVAALAAQREWLSNAWKRRAA